jgi:hypothetical protein
MRERTHPLAAPRPDPDEGLLGRYPDEGLGAGGRGRTEAQTVRPTERPCPNLNWRAASGSPSRRAATHPAQLSRAAGCAARPAQAGRRPARRRLRGGRAATRLGRRCARLVLGGTSDAERLHPHRGFLRGSWLEGFTTSSSPRASRELRSNFRFLFLTLQLSCQPIPQPSSTPPSHTYAQPAATSLGEAENPFEPALHARSLRILGRVVDQVTRMGTPDSK